MQRVYSQLPDVFNQAMPLGPKVAGPIGQMLRIIKEKHKTIFLSEKSLDIMFAA